VKAVLLLQVVSSRLHSAGLQEASGAETAPRYSRSSFEEEASAQAVVEALLVAGKPNRTSQEAAKLVCSPVAPGAAVVAETKR
jgi:hypothetical protein